MSSIYFPTISLFLLSDTATTVLYTLSLHDALPILADAAGGAWPKRARDAATAFVAASKESTPSVGIRLLADLRTIFGDRKSTRLNSSHLVISYAVFCLKKKMQRRYTTRTLDIHATR